MATPNKHIFEQGPVLRALAETAITAALGSNRRMPPASAGREYPEYEATIAPRSGSLIADYVRHVGGDPAAYRDSVPPHLFPQWSFPLAAKTLADAPYPLLKVMNGGCRIEVNGKIPQREPLMLRARLASVDDDGRRAILHQRIVTGTKGSPELLVAHLYAYVPLGNGRGGKDSTSPPGKARAPSAKRHVPESARELAFWKIAPGAGLDFAKLTGDFNPIHWIRPYAKSFGFRSTILHGFSTMARAYEGLGRVLLSGNPHAITLFDARFTRPLPLPAKVGLYIDGGETDRHVYVGDAPGGGVYLDGTFRIRGDVTVGPSFGASA